MQCPAEVHALKDLVCVLLTGQVRVRIQDPVHIVGYRPNARRPLTTAHAVPSRRRLANQGQYYPFLWADNSYAVAGLTLFYSSEDHVSPPTVVLTTS